MVYQMINLYPDQLDIVNKSRVALSQYKNICIQSPTGSGKTVLSSYIVNEMYKKKDESGL